jgi:23S rRNA U2552 (ribose-2'-O)-methylase RlmE/FtsJ
LRTIGIEVRYDRVRRTARANPGGTFLAKVLQGGTAGKLLTTLERDFASVKHVKPAASRADYAELHVPGRDFTARPIPQQPNAT